MNKEDLILQKLDSMDIELKNVRSEMKDIRSEIKDVHSELKEIREDATEMKVNQAKHAGKLETLDTKLDAFIDHARERKTDMSERWKIGGIIVSCGVAVLSLILSILTRIGR